MQCADAAADHLTRLPAPPTSAGKAKAEAERLAAVRAQLLAQVRPRHHFLWGA